MSGIKDLLNNFQTIIGFHEDSRLMNYDHHPILSSITPMMETPLFRTCFYPKQLRRQIRVAAFSKEGFESLLMNCIVRTFLNWNPLDILGWRMAKIKTVWKKTFRIVLLDFKKNMVNNLNSFCDFCSPFLGNHHTLSRCISHFGRGLIPRFLGQNPFLLPWKSLAWICGSQL